MSTQFWQAQLFLALSVRYNEQIRHFVINSDDAGMFYFETHREKTVADLISWHRTTKTPLSSGAPARLRRPIERAEWLLTHDSITLHKKLGEG